MTSASILSIEGVTAGYGATTVLRDVSLSIGDGEVLALLGPNGAGKTTLLRVATGFVKVHAGRVAFRGEDMTGEAPHRFVTRGLCHLPEGRGIFPSLSVRENLTVQARGRDLDEAIAEIAEIFPVLGRRLKQTAGSMSGGEQQMLALSRAYLTNPRLVVVDEASLGLAPLIVDRIYEALARLAERGIALILVEQYAQKALALAKTLCVLRRGEVVHRGAAGQLDVDEIYQRYLGVDS